jgi:ribosomal protein S18 acetylase RimI-like enzyme
LTAEDVGLVARIDRTEHVDVEYAVVHGELQARPARKQVVPPWEPEGAGPHSVAHQRAFCADLVAAGASLLGAFDGQEVLGLAVVDPSFEPSLAWLAFLHVSRPHRRRGAASALWDAAVHAATTAGADAMYVSATPTDSAVGFYLSRGCRLAVPPHPRLHRDEPEDIHLVGPLGSGTTA